MPMLASMCTRIPPTANVCSSAARSRRPAALADASSPGSSTTANSSPPSRASVSPGRSASCRRGPIWRRTSSPAWWPSVSLSSLKPSRSISSSATSPSASAIASPSRCQQMAAVAEPGQVVGDGLAAAHAQAVDDRQPGPRHPGQDGDRRERRRDRRQADELPDDEQRERGRRVRQDRGQDHRVELRPGRAAGSRSHAAAREQRRRQPGSSPSAISPTSAHASAALTRQRAARAPRPRRRRRAWPAARRPCVTASAPTAHAAHQEVQPRERQRPAEPADDHRQPRRRFRARRRRSAASPERRTRPPPRRPARPPAAPRRPGGAGGRRPRHKRGCRRRAPHRPPRRPSRRDPSSPGTEQATNRFQAGRSISNSSVNHDRVRRDRGEAYCPVWELRVSGGVVGAPRSRSSCHLSRKTGKVIEAKTLDLGPGGMRIHTNRPLAPDELLDFELPEHARINGRARVLREQGYRIYARALREARRRGARGDRAPGRCGYSSRSSTMTGISRSVLRW